MSGGDYGELCQGSRTVGDTERGGQIGRGRRIAIFNLDGTFYPIDEECTHAGGPLSEGTIDGEEIECPWHQGRFNIKTGAVVDPPPMDDLASYNVRLSGEDVEVEI